MTSEPFGDIREAQGRELVDVQGRPLGHVRQIFLDETTREPAWATVDAPGGQDRLVLVPLAHATVEGDRVRVAVTSEAVTSSPATDGASDRFQPDHMDRVRRHYEDGPDVAGYGADDRPAASERRDLIGDDDRSAALGQRDRTATEGPATVVRSEEELVIGRERVAHERVRLVKRIVTETVTQTIEVRREELHVERLPLTGVRDVGAGTTGADDLAPGSPPRQDLDAPAPASGATRSRAASLKKLPGVEGALTRLGRSRLGSGGSAFGEDFTDETVDITLMEEQIEITKRVVPRERVRLHREVVVEQRTVSDALRKERVEVERSALEPESVESGRSAPDPDARI